MTTTELAPPVVEQDSDEKMTAHLVCEQCYPEECANGTGFIGMKAICGASLLGVPLEWPFRRCDACEKASHVNPLALCGHVLPYGF